MTSRPWRIFFRITIIILVLVATLCFLSSGYIEGRIKSKITSLGGTVESLDFSIFRGSLVAKNLDWSPVSDSILSTANKINLKNISVSGIRLLPLFLHHVLTIENIVLEDGLVHYAPGQKFYKPQNASGKSVGEIEIGELIFKNVITEVEKDSVLEFSGKVTLDLKGLHWKKSTGSDSTVYEAKSCEILLEKFSSQPAKGEYRFESDRIHFTSEGKRLEIDSLRLLPLLGKYEFAQKAKKQETRVTLKVASINLIGFDYHLLRDSILSVEKIEINNPDLWVFRDKRLPFKNPYIPLPIQSLKRIAFGLKIDSIKIYDGKIKHEEMAENGVTPGHLNFTSLNAKLSNFYNRPYTDRPQGILIEANAKIMKTGFIEATFHMPFEDGKKYHTQGSITHLNLAELNAMTEPMAFLHVESGQLHKLSFTFENDEYFSRGKAEINYENLVMVGFNKGDNKKTINPLKTLLINTFIKKDKNKDTPRENRTGIIYVERDRRKFVANLWAKSLANGIQSVLLPSALVSKEKKPKK